jgi:hypothetical protein
MNKLIVLGLLCLLGCSTSFEQEEAYVPIVAEENCDPGQYCDSQDPELPAGPYCPPDKPLINQECFDALANLYKSHASIVRQNACNLSNITNQNYQSDLSDCLDLYNNCITNTGNHYACSKVLKDCSDRAARRRDKARNGICLQVDVNMQLLNEAFYNSVEKCCEKAGK